MFSYTAKLFSYAGELLIQKTFPTLAAAVKFIDENQNGSVRSACVVNDNTNMAEWAINL